MKFHSVATAMLIASSTGVPVLAQASGATEQSSISTSEAAMPILPTRPKEFLVSIQSALAKGELLNETFYSIANLQHFFGVGYRFTEGKDEVGQKTIYLDDGGNKYFDEQGNLTPLGRNRPCVWRGNMEFKAGSPGRRAMGRMALLTIAKSAPTSSFSANLVLEVFGVPSAITKGFPITPPLHGLPYVATPQTNELGNRWLTYQAELDGHFQQVEFLTIGDATVTEIQLFEEQR